MLRDIIRAVGLHRAVVSLTVLGVVTTAFLAYTASSPGEAVSLALLASIFQVLAGIVSVKGRADPNFVKSAIGRLADIGLKIRLAELKAQAAYEQGTPQIRREALGILSVTMSYLQEETRHAVEDWQNLNPEAVETLIQENGLSGKVTPQAQEAPNV
jgi:hypothetical protein